MSIVHIHFEPDADAADRQSLDRLKHAIARYDAGEALAAEEHITFQSLEALLALLTPRRMELLRHLHRTPAHSIKALAAALGRDYRRVHDDVTALLSVGLIVRDDTGLQAPHAEIRFALRLDGETAAA